MEKNILIMTEEQIIIIATEIYIKIENKKLSFESFLIGFSQGLKYTSKKITRLEYNRNKNGYDAFIVGYSGVKSIIEVADGICIVTYRNGQKTKIIGQFVAYYA